MESRKRFVAICNAKVTDSPQSTRETTQITRKYYETQKCFVCKWRVTACLLRRAGMKKGPRKALFV